MKQQNLAHLDLGFAELTPCVICYVPGSGVNKLLQVLSNDFELQMQTHGAPATSGATLSNSAAFQDQKFARPPYEVWPRYTTIDSIEPWPCQRNVAVSHCMSTPIIQHQFPGRHIIKIFGDFMLSLRRCHVTYAQFQDCANPDVHARWSPWLDIFQKNAGQLHIAHQILYHLDYYQQHWDRDCDFFIDISQNNCYFSNFMMADFQRCKDADFDKVCEVLQQSPEVQDILRGFA